MHICTESPGCPAKMWNLPKNCPDCPKLPRPIIHEESFFHTCLPAPQIPKRVPLIRSDNAPKTTVFFLHGLYDLWVLNNLIGPSAAFCLVQRAFWRCETSQKKVWNPLEEAFCENQSYKNTALNYWSRETLPKIGQAAHRLTTPSRKKYFSQNIKNLDF